MINYFIIKNYKINNFLACKAIIVALLIVMARRMLVSWSVRSLAGKPKVLRDRINWNAQFQAVPIVVHFMTVFLNLIVASTVVP